MELYTDGGRRWTDTCLYSLAVIPVLSPLESQLALESLLESLLRNLIDSLLDSCLIACLGEPRLREPHFGRSRVFHGKLLGDGTL